MMVKLSKVNMFLHGFSDPQIHEYDTLSNDARWNEKYDLIMANPPFMTPKGGVVPHTKFRIAAKKAEVLFTDYIAEHLTTNGRAGIIVPDGIVFRAQAAYVKLRRFLIEDSLVAVITLPSGVFKPYSGVSTSILILDKTLASRRKEILFIKVTADGFDLGDKRTPIQENDLPEAAKVVRSWIKKDQPNAPETNLKWLATTREELLQHRISSLNPRGFIETEDGSNTEYEEILIGDICEILDSKRKPITKAERKAGPFPYYGATGCLDYVEGFLFDEPLVLIGEDGAEWGTNQKCAYAISGKTWVNNHAHVLRPDRSKVLDTYLIEVLNRKDLNEYITGSTVRKLNQANLREIRVPLPPLETQKEIVAEIEGYQKVIDGARAVVDNYKPQITIDPKWPVVELGEVCKPEYGFTESALDKGDARFIRITDISGDGKLKQDEAKYVALTDESRKSLLTKGDILVARTGATFAKTMLFNESYPAVFASFLIRLRFSSDKILPEFYWAFAQSLSYWTQARKLMTGGGQPQFNGNAIIQVKLPVPSLEEQRNICSEHEKEQAMVNANKELIALFEKKIQTVMDRVWGKGTAE
jgi:type I restriction enzyme M protein